MFLSQPLPIFARLLLGLLPLCWTCYFPFTVLLCTVHVISLSLYMLLSLYATCHFLRTVHVTSLSFYMLLPFYYTSYFFCTVRITSVSLYMLLSLYSICYFHCMHCTINFSNSIMLVRPGITVLVDTKSCFFFCFFFFLPFFFLEKIVAFISACKHTPGQRHPCASWLCMWLPLLS